MKLLVRRAVETRRLRSIEREREREKKEVFKHLDHEKSHFFAQFEQLKLLFLEELSSNTQHPTVSNALRAHGPRDTARVVRQTEAT